MDTYKYISFTIERPGVCLRQLLVMEEALDDECGKVEHFIINPEECVITRDGEVFMESYVALPDYLEG